LLKIYYLKLNRFTINSINHNHYNDNDRQALSDDTNAVGNFWLRTAGMGYGLDHHFRTVAGVWRYGGRNAGNATYTGVGFRPLL